MIAALVLPIFLAAAPPDSCPLALADATPIQLAIRLTAYGVRRWGCDSDVTARATWSPPDEGAPVVMYELQLDVCGAWPDTTVLIPVPTWADSLRARARGVDAQGRHGEWGDWGPWYNPEVAR